MSSTTVSSLEAEAIRHCLQTRAQLTSSSARSNSPELAECCCLLSRICTILKVIASRLELYISHLQLQRRDITALVCSVICRLTRHKLYPFEFWTLFRSRSCMGGVFLSFTR